MVDHNLSARRSLRVWLVTAIAFFAWMGFLLMIPRPYSSLLLILMLAGGVIFYSRRQGLPPRPALNWPTRIRPSPKTAAILSLIAMILSAYLLDPTAPSRPAILALPLVIIGGAALWMVLKDHSAPELTIVPTESGHISWRPLIGGILLLALLAESNSHALQIVFFQHVSSHIQFALFCGGIVLVITGLVGRLPAITHVRLNTTPHLILLAITLFALIMRLWHIGTAVPVFVDETLFPGVIMRFWKEGDTGILMRSDQFFFTSPTCMLTANGGQWVCLAGRWPGCGFSAP